MPTLDEYLSTLGVDGDDEALGRPGGVLGPVEISRAGTPVGVAKSDANISLTTSGDYVDTDPSGTSAARNLDVVIPNVATGQQVSMAGSFRMAAGSGFGFFRFATIVGGSIINTFAVPGWSFNTIEKFATGEAAPYTLASGDIEGGSVRLRLQSITTAARTISASSGYVFNLWGRSHPFV